LRIEVYFIPRGGNSCDLAKLPTSNFDFEKVVWTGPKLAHASPPT
jgi:hypothetical protein